MTIRKQAAQFYKQAAQGTDLEQIMTDEAADRMGRAFELCARIKARTNATKAVAGQQAEHKVNIKDAIILGLLLIGYILGNTIAPTEWTERGTQDPALTGPIIWINE